MPPSGWLFPGQKPVNHLTTRQLNRAFHAAKDAAGIDKRVCLGLTLRQHSTGGKQRLGRTSKMGQRDIRRLLIIGAMSRIASARRHKRKVERWLQDNPHRTVTFKPA